MRNGQQWTDGPLYNRFIRWNCPGVFDRIFVTLTEQADRWKRLMIDATHLKAHKTAVPCLKRGFLCHVERTKGRLPSKLYAVCDGKGLPVRLYLISGQAGHFRGADVLLADLPDKTK